MGLLPGLGPLLFEGTSPGDKRQHVISTLTALLTQIPICVCIGKKFNTFFGCFSFGTLGIQKKIIPSISGEILWRELKKTRNNNGNVILNLKLRTIYVYTLYGVGMPKLYIYFMYIYIYVPSLPFELPVWFSSSVQLGLTE